MSDIQIEKDIPIPPIPRSGGRHKGRWKRKYPFPDMGIGDSFFVPAESKAAARSRANVLLISAREWGARDYGFKFTTRTYEDGVRIWRTK